VVSSRFRGEAQVSEHMNKLSIPTSRGLGACPNNYCCERLSDGFYKATEERSVRDLLKSG